LDNGIREVATSTLTDDECECIVNASLETFDADLREMAQLSVNLMLEERMYPRAFLNVYLAFHESVFGEVFAY
jgi:hypothetical protein